MVSSADCKSVALGCDGSTPSLSTILGVAQSGSASALGAEGRRFESYHRDHMRVSYSGNTSAFQADAVSSILTTRSSNIHRGE